MAVTVADVMRHVRNYFVAGAVTGSWRAENGTLLPQGVFSPGEWVAVCSPFGAPGVWQIDEDGGLPGVPDCPEWEGEICLLNPPEDFLRLCEEIAGWAESHADPALTGEKFSQYSRKMRDSRWQTAFDAALAPYRRMYPEVKV